MGSLRAYLQQHRGQALALVLLALCMKALLPGGFMLAQQQRHLVIQFCHDAAIGSNLVVHLNGPVDTFTSAAAIAAGVNVEAAAAGKAQTATTGRVLGIALTAATAADQTVQVLRA